MKGQAFRIRKFTIGAFGLTSPKRIGGLTGYQLVDLRALGQTDHFPTIIVSDEEAVDLEVYNGPQNFNWDTILTTGVAGLFSMCIAPPADGIEAIDCELWLEVLE